MRTRLAPSPTGEIHIGHMRTLLYDYVLAKKSGGKFILRIEDTDRERYVEGAVERIIDVIKDYGLSYDEGPEIGGPHEPYTQSERLDTYRKYALELVEKKKAYYCFCPKERLAEMREEQQKKGVPTTKYDKHCLDLSDEEVKKYLEEGKEFVVRLNVPKGQEIKFKDEVLGDLSFPSDDIDDQVLLKSDGYPTYHLGVVVDDHLMEITHILRGMEWLPSTPKHILIYEAFGWEVPKLIHLPLLREADSTKKLSKRSGSVGAMDFLEEGYLPEALLNFLMFLGWNPGTEKEIYTLDEFIEDFSIEKIQKTDLVVFDRQKLLWFNGMYIRGLDVKDLFERINKWGSKFDIKLNSKDKKYDLEVLELVRERMKVLSEWNELTDYFYSDPEIPADLLHKYSGSEEKTKEIVGKYLDLYKNVDEKDWNFENLEKISHELLEGEGYKPKEAFMTLRVIVTGRSFSPPLFNTLEVLGKDNVVKRMSSI
ncbi:glutamate--tRNA ligase [Patescibacteria group bacterium]